jgi:RNA polymerase sigma-70 factor (ECF subfamily)
MMPVPVDRDGMRKAAERAARASYGRLVALLAARTGDIAAAEDALSDAFAAALATWPERGVPDAPEAWLFASAKNALYKRFRHLKVESAAGTELDLRGATSIAPVDLGEGWSDLDDRLKLLFVCAHPSIDASMRTPLMLQTVLGLDAQRIGSAFLVAPTTMGQRLVRAKAKIKTAAIRFAVPDERELPERLADVLEAIYAAYGTGWDNLDGTDGRGLVEESVFLARLIISLLPSEPEPRGLLSLMLFCESRRAARRDEAGRFVPLMAQDTRRWSRPMVAEAETLLAKAAEAKQFGRFQCEAAIQSVHAQRAITGEVHHEALRMLYDLLLAHAPSVGVAVGRAAALLDAGDHAGATTSLDAIDPRDVQSYQPYWVLRGGLAEASGERETARRCIERGIGLTEDEAVRAFLLERLKSLE